jgi:hypothetical protein
MEEVWYREYDHGGCGGSSELIAKWRHREQARPDQARLNAVWSEAWDARREKSPNEAKSQCAIAKSKGRLAVSAGDLTVVAAGPSRLLWPISGRKVMMSGTRPSPPAHHR